MKRTFAAVAREIKATWTKPYFGAVPYLEALEKCETTDKDATYICERVKDLVPYLLCNMTTFRGADARRLKAELKEMIK